MGGDITSITSFTRLQSTASLHTNYNTFSLFGQIQSCNIGGQPYSDSCPNCEYSQCRWIKMPKRVVTLVAIPFMSFLMGHPRPLYHLFSSFQTNFTIFTTNKCEKCPSSKWCWDLNPQPLDHESPPITTLPGFPPFVYSFILRLRFQIPLTRDQR